MGVRVVHVRQLMWSVQWMTAVNCVEVFLEERPETLPQVAS